MRGGRFALLVFILTAVAACGDVTPPPTSSPVPSKSASSTPAPTSAAEAYTALARSSTFNVCAYRCGPPTLHMFLDGLNRISFPAAMHQDVEALILAVEGRISALATYQPPGSDGGVKALKAADEAVRRDLGLPPACPPGCNA